VNLDHQTVVRRRAGGERAPLVRTACSGPESPRHCARRRSVVLARKLSDLATAARAASGIVDERLQPGGQVGGARIAARAVPGRTEDMCVSIE